ncbi:solute:proton antiporter [Aureococcus anophagefferens]|nr:solute:proton antiporter [Aureococcus anophagefferens]
MGLELSLERLSALKREILGIGVAQMARRRRAAAAGWCLRTGAGAPLDLGAQLDLAVVPLLVVIPLLASGGAGVGGGAVAGAVLGAAVKGLVSLAAVELIGKRAIDSLFYFAAQSRSQEAFLAVVLLTVLAMSATTEAVGLSATLGAFSRAPLSSQASASRSACVGVRSAGLLLGPGGEFGFVAFGLATVLVLDAATAEFLRTTTALSMALTPVLASAGERLQEPVNNWAAKLARRTRRERDDEAAVLASKQGDDLKATDARARGLPVFFGDLGRQEVLEYFKVGAAKIVVVATQDRPTNRVVALRRLYPDLEIIARAENRDHQRRLSKMLGWWPWCPLPEDSRFLTLPRRRVFALNYDQSDVDMLIEESRRALGIMSGSTDTLVAEEQSSMLEQLGMNDGEPPSSTSATGGGAQGRGLSSR